MITFFGNLLGFPNQVLPLTYRVKVLQKGKVTLPQPIREQLGIREGDELFLNAEADRVVIRTRKMMAEPTRVLAGLAAGVGLSRQPKKDLRRATAGILRRKLERTA